MGKAQDARLGVNYPPHDPPVVLLEKPNKFPQWSEERLREMAAAEDEALSATGGLLACSPELYAEMEKTVRQKFADGVSCGHAGCLSHVSHPCEGCGRVGGYRRQDGGIGDEIDYADQEQYLDMKRSVKNQLEGVDAVEGAGETGQDRQGSGRIGGKYGLRRQRFVQEGNKWKEVESEETHGSDGSAKIEGRNRDGNGGSGVYDTHAQSPGNHREGLSQTGNSEGGGSSSSVSGETLNMDALRDICAEKIPNNIYCECGDEMCLRCNKCKGCEGCECPDAAEIEICGFKSFNDTDGEWYMCCKEKHPYPKVKHGEWVKI
ncbi:unnamed protein product [Sphagnum jensenii]